MTKQPKPAIPPAQSPQGEGPQREGLQREGDEPLPETALDQVSGGTEMVSNVSKTRSEISMTFARNSRG